MQMLSKIKLDKNRLSSFGKARWNEAHTMRQFKVVMRMTKEAKVSR
jgi:hypothetical protein